MPRDPLNRKIGRNNQCWCGSGIRFKYCHYNREHQVSRPIGYFEHQFHSVEQKSGFCSCEFDASNCASQIVRSHTVSKAASLAEIALDGHVLSLEINPAFSADDSRGVDAVSFKQEGIGRASTVRAFCSYHDRLLFFELDKFDMRDKERFHWQLLYRTVCFELFRKFVAKEYAPAMRGMDAGLTPLQQAYWQDHVTRFQVGQSLGFKDLNQFRIELEETYRNRTFANDVVFLSYALATKLPIAAAGVFQPDLAPNGECLQIVNRFVRTNDGFAAAPLHKLCMSIVPTSNATVLSMSTLRGHEKAIRFMEGFMNQAGHIIDEFIGLSVLKMENVYFNPAFIGSLADFQAERLRRLHSFGVGEDVKPEEMRLSRQLGLFKEHVATEKISNLA